LYTVVLYTLYNVVDDISIPKSLVRQSAICFTPGHNTVVGGVVSTKIHYFAVVFIEAKLSLSSPQF